MSRPPQYEDGAYGVPGAHPQGGEPQEPPNVYHPSAETTPAYDGYADPAVAHGWQNAYDATTELPRVPDDGGAGVGDVEWESAGRGPEADGDADTRSGRRALRRRGSRRRAAIAAGAVGAVSLAALIGGLSFSGSSSPGSQDKDGGTRSVPDESADATGPASSGDPSAPDSSGTADSGAPTSTASASASSSTSGQPSGDPSATSSTGTATTPSATSSGGPGNSSGKGHGQGSTKGPK